jgi:hypothetical protein
MSHFEGCSGWLFEYLALQGLLCVNTGRCVRRIACAAQPIYPFYACVAQKISALSMPNSTHTNSIQTEFLKCDQIKAGLRDERWSDPNQRNNGVGMIAEAAYKQLDQTAAALQEGRFIAAGSEQNEIKAAAWGT